MSGQPAAPEHGPIADQPAALGPDQPEDSSRSGDEPRSAPSPSAAASRGAVLGAAGPSSAPATRSWLRHHLAPYGVRLLLAELAALVVFAIAVALLTSGGSDNHPPARTIAPAATTIPAPTAPVNVGTTAAPSSGVSTPSTPRSAPPRRKHPKLNI